MPQIKQGLRAGKGLRSGPDAYANQYESDSIRQQLNDPTGGWFIGLRGDQVYTGWDTTGAAFGTANTAFLYFLPERVRVVRPKEARVVVISAGAAGALMKCALYAYTRGNGAVQLVKIPGTDASFDCTGTGLIKVPLASSPDISPHQRLVMSIWVNDTTITFQGFSGVAGVKPVGRLQLATTTPNAPVYKVSDLTMGGSPTKQPDIVYLSQEAANLL